jgi:hypothetical protein
MMGIIGGCKLNAGAWVITILLRLVTSSKQQHSLSKIGPSSSSIVRKKWQTHDIMLSSDVLSQH